MIINNDNNADLKKTNAHIFSYPAQNDNLNNLDERQASAIVILQTLLLGMCVVITVPCH